MGLLKRLFGASDRGTAPQLYASIVAMGRAPHWYIEGGVPDTIDGRFDMIAAVLSLVLLRLEGEAEAKAPSTALAECFIDVVALDVGQILVQPLQHGFQVSDVCHQQGLRRPRLCRRP